MDHSSKVIWLNQGHEFWDQTLIKQLLKELPDHERQIVVVPGAINTPTEINAILSQYSKVLVIITSDEENKFGVGELNHPDMMIYVTYPKLPDHMRVDRFLPIGTPKMPQIDQETKKLAWFFSGQVNHKGREDLVSVLRELSGGKLVETKGFSQGLEYPEYLKWMNLSSVIPCPGGQSSPDSFRLYESLELGCIPITDNPGFFEMLFYDVPFPTISDWSTLPNLINNLKDRPEQNNICQAWWIRTKRQLRYNLEDDLGIKPEGLTVLIPTSPIPSHPSTEIIEQTINSIRERLDSEIILMIDGVRDEQKDRTANYNEYVRRLLWKCNFEWKNVYPILFETHQHQANMCREALKHVRTDKILYVEHDTPLTGEIPFQEIMDLDANVVRLMHEANILEPHQYLMLDEGNRFTKTAQWSQRPHIASTEYYRKIIEEYFPPSGRTMIEDKMHGVLANAYHTRGLVGWNEHKVYIYTPEGDMKRSLNLDGRKDDLKYEMKYE